MKLGSVERNGSQQLDSLWINRVPSRVRQAAEEKISLRLYQFVDYVDRKAHPDEKGTEAPMSSGRAHTWRMKIEIL
jgi:hypothetical protein